MEVTFITFFATERPPAAAKEEIRVEEEQIKFGLPMEEEELDVGRLDIRYIIFIELFWYQSPIGGNWKNPLL